MNRWTKVAAGLVAMVALTGIAVSLPGGGIVISNGRTWADGPVSATGR